MPIIKPNCVLERMKGKDLISIKPEGDDYDWKYARENNIKTSESRYLPERICEEMLQEIRWFPIKKWYVI